jgi:hypothetical protein
MRRLNAYKPTFLGRDEMKAARVRVKYYLDALNFASRFTTGNGFAPRTYGIEVGYRF